MGAFLQINNTKGSFTALQTFCNILSEAKHSSQAEYVIKQINPHSNTKYGRYIGFVSGLVVSIDFTKTIWNDDPSADLGGGFDSYLTGTAGFTLLNESDGWAVVDFFE